MELWKKRATCNHGSGIFDLLESASTVHSINCYCNLCGREERGGTGTNARPRRQRHSSELFNLSTCTLGATKVPIIKTWISADLLIHQYLVDSAPYNYQSDKSPYRLSACLMILHTLPSTMRDSINPGVLASSAAAAAESSRQNHNTSKLGKIIGIVISVVILILVIGIAVCYDRRRKRKSDRQGTKLRETGVEDGDEKSRPMVQQQMEVPRSLVLQPSATSFPSHSEAMYGGGGYGPRHVPMGHQ